MNVIMVASPYYVETLIDAETGAVNTVIHRLSEAVMRYNGRYTMYRDCLALAAGEIVPDHGLAVDLLWFDASAEEQAALVAIRDAYAVLMEGEVEHVGEIPGGWPG
jgi:hypothetical protein